MPNTHHHKSGDACPAEEQAKRACDFLEHFHTEHTQDVITRFHGEDADVLIVSDPIWRERLERYVEAAFHPEHPAVTSLKTLIRKLQESLDALETDTNPEKQQYLLGTVLRPLFVALASQIPETAPKPPEPPVQ